MAREFTPKVVTGNALIEGDVVYLTKDDTWTRKLSEAEVMTEEDHAQLRLLQAEGQPEQVVGPYLADVAAGEDGPGAPGAARRRLRRRGRRSRGPHRPRASLGEAVAVSGCGRA